MNMIAKGNFMSIDGTNYNWTNHLDFSHALNLIRIDLSPNFKMFASFKFAINLLLNSILSFNFDKFIYFG